MIIVENRKDFLYNLPKAENVDGKNPLGIYDANTLSYINGGQPISESSEKKTEEKSSADRMSVLLNEKLRKNPHDVQTWLAFVNIQDINSFQTVEENSSNKLENHKEKTSCRALMERKVSILDKAIENNPQSIQLIATRLDIASHYWSPPAMEQEWKNALFLNPVSHDLLYFSIFFPHMSFVNYFISFLQIQDSEILWKKYLAFIEGHFESFSISNVLKG